jgi:hypothetical protein
VRRLRGVLSGYLTLVVLYVIVQREPAGKLSGLAGTVTGLINRGLDPQVAAVPDRSTGSWQNNLPGRAPAGADVPAGTPPAPSMPGAGPAPGANFSTVRG